MGFKSIDNPVLCFFKAVLFMLFCFFFCNAATAASPLKTFYPDINTISMGELFDKLPAITLIDIRQPFEFDVIHMDGAINLPLGSEQFNIKLKEVKKQLEPVELVFVSNDPDCPRAFKAARLARQFGLTNVSVYDTGISSWLLLFPEKTWLMGEMPAQLETVLPLQKHQVRQISFGRLSKLGNNENSVIVDIRDAFIRIYVPAGVPVRNVTMQGILEGIGNRVWAEKTLLIIDTDGSRTRWLQLFLQAAGFHDYYFLAGGVNSLQKTEKVLLTDSVNDQVTINQEKLKASLTKLHKNPDATGLLGYILASIRFENVAFIPQEELISELKMELTKIEGLSNYLSDYQEILYFKSDRNYIFRVNPALAWKGEMRGSHWQENVNQFSNSFKNTGQGYKE